MSMFNLTEYKKAMKVENVILIISIIVMLIGIWAVYYSLKLWNPNYRPRKLIAKLIRQSLGSKGTQIFTIIFGTVLILFGSGMTYMTLTKGKLNPYSSYNKSEWITISVFNAQMGAILRSKVSLEKQKISRSGKDHLKNYQTVSFKNNGIKEIPNFVWDMSNLEKLDMTNNELKKNS